MQPSANFIMALTRDFQFLSTLNIEERTEDLCWLAVRYCGCALEWVPQQFKTAELCDLAIRTFSEGLPHIPEQFKTPELYLKAMQYWGDLKNVHENMKTYKICLAGLSHCGKILNLCQLALRDKNFSWQKAIPRTFWRTLNLSAEWQVHSENFVNLLKEK